MGSLNYTDQQTTRVDRKINRRKEIDYFVKAGTPVGFMVQVERDRRARERVEPFKGGAECQN